MTTAYGLHAQGKEIVLTLNRLVEPGQGDELVTAWGVTVRTSIRNIAEIRRYPNTAQGRRVAQADAERLTLILYPSATP